MVYTLGLGGVTLKLYTSGSTMTLAEFYSDKTTTGHR